jgi:hypothetical protein
MLKIDISNNIAPHYIIKIYCDRWNEDSHLFVESFLNDLQQIIDEHTMNKTKCILLCDCKGDIPCMSVLLKIFKHIVGIRNQMESTVNFTVIYTKDNSYKSWFDILLKFYTPKRPVYPISNRKELKALIQNDQQTAEPIKL